MESIKTIFKIGYGPSSSHTMGPAYAAEIFLNKNLDKDSFTVELYGSLAFTGKGHLTDKIIKEVFKDKKIDVIFNYEEVYNYHPNGMKFRSFKDGVLCDEWICFSVGGGDIRSLGEERSKEDLYKLNNLDDIIKHCKQKNISFIDFVDSVEDTNEYFVEVIEKMQKSVENGLICEDILPGSLKLEPRAKKMFLKNDGSLNSLITSYALACSEENARGHIVVTAPTCGSCGVVASVVYYALRNFSKEEVIDSLKVAGLIGAVVRNNASISGAEVGCQGEIGVACSMASALYCYLLGGTLEQIEYAAEIALEHHLGMTCDPINGYVQIPCIERNAMSAIFAINAAQYAFNTDGKHFVSFDHVVEVMKETGLDLHVKYKETSAGGLAKIKK